LAARDFDNDKKDAGEIGAGHTVTALYEIVPVRDPRTEWKADERAEDEPGASPLKYQKVVRPAAALSEAADSNELATVRLRYKRPDGQKSQLLEEIAPAESKSFSTASPDFQFASAVASFAMVLRGSRFAGDATLAAIEEYAAPGLANDAAGHRTGFVDLVRKARELVPVEKSRGERR
ncbi:MAG TPA: hypothetical protein DD670_11375, partial [Planctomycetaceae bacterium]|nr:hypothetical protein [Planctomycetaceae bacterium]